MAQAQGSASKTFVGVEYDPQASKGSWGAGTIPTGYKGFYIPFKTNTVRKSVDQVLSEQITASRNPSAPARGNVDISGDISAELECKAHGLLWFLALGMRSVTAIVTATTYYKHQFWVGQNLPSAIIDKQFTDISEYFKYAGAMLNTLSLTVSSSGYAELTANFMGKDETSGATAFYTTATNSVDLTGTTFDNFLATVGEGAGGSFSNMGSLLEFTFEYNNNLDGSSVLVGGSGVRAGIAAGVPTISGNLRVIFENETLYDKAVNKTETGLQVTLKNNATPTGQDGAEKAVITLPEVYLTPNAPAIEGMGGVTMDLAYSGFYSNETTTGKTTACHVELWNQVVDYTDGA